MESKMKVLKKLSLILSVIFVQSASSGAPTVSMLTEKNTAISQMSSIVDDAKEALDIELNPTLSFTLNAIETTALADNNIVNNKTQYVNQVNTLSLTGATALQNAASNYISNVQTIQSTAIENLGLLAAQNGDN